VDEGATGSTNSVLQLLL